eukprot:TRINITY_DN1205_c0_g3_i2.p1 TRINITY_DN1205_c0_g3~~TRINITY_DN1205_c0_g3_i2.p1  ORF type:complete len:395 (+),score=129.81 TRINITY_DN1205_c0_g3_i2:92-1276(+)
MLPELKMKPLLLILALVGLSIATSVDLQSDLGALLASKARASDAIDAVLGLLGDLKRSSLHEQQTLEQRNRTQEGEGTRTVAQYSDMLNKNEKQYQDAINHREYIEKEMQDTENHITWIETRLEEIQRKLDELAVQRCQANSLFVQALKEHSDALKSLKFVANELKRLQGSGELTEIKSLTQKFLRYENLFEKEVVTKFISLGKGEEGAASAAEGEKAEASKPAPSGAAGQILQMLSNLEQSLRSSMRSLEEHEIQAAYDYAEFKSQSEIENTTLREDMERKHKYLAKLEVDIEVAREYEDKCRGIRDDSSRALDAAQADLDARRAFYAQEATRIREEQATLDEIINIFHAKVASMQVQLRDRVDSGKKGSVLLEESSNEEASTDDPPEDQDDS